MKNEKITRENVGVHLLEYQFKLIGKTYEEALLNKNWLTEWKIKDDKHKEWREYSILVIKKLFKCNRTRAISTFNFLDFDLGLTVIE